MKKSALYTIVGVSALAISTTLTVIASTVSASEQQNNNNANAIVAETTVAPASNKIAAKDETVYIVTDATGEATKSFVGSELNTSNTPFPVTMQISYTLDGKEITAEDLAGKSGHVTIKYDFTATKNYQDKLVPFLTMTELSLDSAKFSNVKIDHGKVLKESDPVMLVGYTMAGVNEDFGIDFLPSTFTVEADTTDFALDTSYSFATNEIFADIDTSKLSSIDGIVGAINDLSSGLEQIIAGSTRLTEGLDAALSGSDKLEAGANALGNGAKALNDGAAELAGGAATLADKSTELASGIGSLAEGASGLSGGLAQVAAGSASLNQGAEMVFNSLLENANTKINENLILRYIISAYRIDFPLTIANYDNSLTTLAARISSIGGTASELNTLKVSLNGYSEFYAGVIRYTGAVDYIADQSANLSAGAGAIAGKMPEFTAGVNSLAEGAATLADGTTTLLSGATELSLGASSLSDGLAQLDAGGHALSDGLATFKTSGIDRLVEFANGDLSAFLYNARQTVSAARSYRYYSNPSANSVKFVFKTPSVK